MIRDTFLRRIFALRRSILSLGSEWRCQHQQVLRRPYVAGIGPAGRHVQLPDLSCPHADPVPQFQVATQLAEPNKARELGRRHYSDPCPPARALPQQSPPCSAKVVYVCFGSKRSIIVSIPLPPYHRTPALKGVPCNVALFYENKMCSCLFYCDLATNAARNLCPFFYCIFIIFACQVCQSETSMVDRCVTSA